jgi:hypothetical protein
MSKTIEDKLKDIRSLMNLGKYEKAQEKIEEVILQDLLEVTQDKKNAIYYRCIYYKANCLWNRAHTTGNAEYIKQCIRLYEEALGLAIEENKLVVQITTNLGAAYYNLGFFQKDKEILKIAIRVLETALEKDIKNPNRMTVSTHITLGNVYQTMANYSNKEEYLKKSLEELEYTHDEISKGKHPYDEAIIKISRASALRKLNEINFNENYKTKAVDNLNDSIKYLNSIYNKHYKKYFPRQYAVQRFYMTEAYFERFKICGLDEDKEAFRQAINEVKEYCDKENNEYYKRKIDEMLEELPL